MPANIIDGRKIAAQVREVVKTEIESSGLKLKIISLLVGGSDAAEVYIKQKAKACEEVGIGFEVVRLPKDSSEMSVITQVIKAGGTPNVSGIIVELPLPSHLDVGGIAVTIPTMMDVDGMNPENLGRLLMGRPCLAPSTPLAVMDILDRENVKLEGADVTIVNHSNIVGKPLAVMLLNRNASVRVAHAYTKDLKAYTKDADVLITAAGVPGLIKADMVKKGATVIDVAMNRVGDKLCGDVEFEEVVKKAKAITPVPGGVGPVTVAMFLKNALLASKLQKLAGP